MNHCTIDSFNNELKKYVSSENYEVRDIKNKLYIRDHKINSEEISIHIDSDEQILYLNDVTNTIFPDITISAYKNKLELTHFIDDDVDIHDNRLNVDVHVISYPDDESDFFMSTLKCKTFNMNYETTVLIKSLYDILFED